MHLSMHIFVYIHINSHLSKYVCRIWTHPVFPLRIPSLLKATEANVLTMTLYERVPADLGKLYFLPLHVIVSHIQVHTCQFTICI